MERRVVEATEVVMPERAAGEAGEGVEAKVVSAVWIMEAKAVPRGAEELAEEGLAVVQTAGARSVGAVAGGDRGVRSEEGVAAVASQQVRTGE